MNLFENLQLMKESDASNHIYNGKSYWSVNDMNSLYKETALKINKINKNDRMKLFPELKKYDHKMSFMPKYSKGLLSPYGYPTSINGIIASPEHDTFLDEDELWDVIEDLIKINNYLDGVDINKLPKYEPPKRHYNTNGNTKESLIDKAIQKYGKDNFELEILGKFEDYNEKEQYYIQYYKSLAPYGYNILKGGEEPPHFSGENHPRALISQQ